MKKLSTLLIFAFSMLVIGSAFAKVEKFKVDNVRTEKVEAIKIQPVDVLNDAVNSVSDIDQTENLEFTISKSKADLLLRESSVQAFNSSKPGTDYQYHTDIFNRVIHEDPGR